MFQIKDFTSIAASQINYAKASQSKITDFNVGSVARTILEAPAIEIEEFYQRMLAGVLEAIPVAIYQGFNFQQLGLASAGGAVVVTFQTPLTVALTIAAGAVFQNPTTGIRHQSSAAVTALIGATSMSIPVSALTPGSIGNSVLNQITVSINNVFPSGSVIGNQPIFSGRDGETEQDRLIRFLAYVNSLSRGTVAALRYGAATAVVSTGSGTIVEYVTRVGLVEGRGSVDIYLHSSIGAPSDDLLENAQAIIDGTTVLPGYRAAGVEVMLLPMAVTAVNVGLTLSLLPGYSTPDRASIVSQITSRLAGLFNSIEEAQVLRVEDIIEEALAVAGVRIANTTNNANVVCGGDEKLALGALTVTWNA